MNTICIDKVAATILNMLGAKPDEKMAAPINEVLDKSKGEWKNGKSGKNSKIDRVFMYNPDAIGQWVYKKYESKFAEIKKEADLEIPMLSVMMSVTPVCFASMYSGLQPDGHGIHEYVKPVLKCRTVFDEVIAAAKKPAIVSTANDSISMIFLERKMDYFIYPTKEECNAKALELIDEDKYDLIVLYNGDYDSWMHKVTPEGDRALQALDENVATYCEIRERIKDKWKNHNTALAFAPDHGCHYNHDPEHPNKLGAHGLFTEEDMNIVHFWTFI